MDYRKFEIGQDVVVFETVEPDKRGNKKILSKKVVGKLVGKIVGLKRFYLGTRESGHCAMSMFDNEYGYSPAYLHIEHTVVCWKIQRGLFNKPIFALEDDIEQLHKATKFPILYQERPQYSDKHRQMMREEMKDVPRDSKGRWMKVNK